MNHSIATVSLSGTLVEKVKAIALAGYDGLELFENDLTASNLSPEELRTMLVDFDLELVGLQPFRDYEAMPEPFKSRNLERAKQKFELMHRIGTRKLFICSNTSIHTINSLDKAAEDLFDIAELAKVHGFEVGYEALSWGRYVSTYHQSVEIVKRANHPNLGNILDNFHISAVKSTFEDIYTIPKHKITMVQVADANQYDMGAMHIARHLRCFPGQGSYPVQEFVKAIQSTGYDGYLSHEIFNDDFRAFPTEQTAKDGKRSLVWLAPPAPRGGATNSPSGGGGAWAFEFIEFTTNESSENALIEWLTKIGFAETFQHKTKAVKLFQLGQVNIVLNSQPLPKAENTVCAVGFVVKNVEEYRNWAKQLNYDWHDSNAQSHELNIPSVTGFGNISFYLVDEDLRKNNFYETEFNRTNNQISENGISHIDHLGHTTSYEHFLSNILFYRTFLGLGVAEVVDIFDPQGIVFSRVAINESRSVRVSLNSSKNTQTLAEKFINQSGSEGIQQIALTTDDIFKTAGAIHCHGIVLPIPANYYADLRTKMVLSDEEIANLERFDILYDKNHNGAFYHFYLKSQFGLFFEVVQRIADYDNYGEINAQVRLAAQQRNS